MKKMAKRFFSSVIVLAMLMALLPATVSQAAIAKAAYGFEDGQMIPSKVHGASTAEIDSTVAYNGSSSMKIVQEQGLATYGKNVTFEVGKTYRISAMYKFAAESSDRSVGFALYAAADQKAKTKVAYTESVWQSVTSDESLWWMDRGTNVKVNDTEWHKVSTTLTLKSVDGTTTAQSLLVELRAEGGKNTFWVDDFSVVEVLSIEENIKGNAMAVKTFEGASTELPATNVARTTAEAYEGTASVKVNNASSPAVQIGTYNLEVGQYYRVTSYVKTDYAEDDTSTGWVSYDLRHTKDLAGVVTVKPKFSGFTENRQGYSYGFQGYEQYDGTTSLQKIGFGWYRMGGAPVSAKDNGQWQRHERIFYVEGPADASVTSADMQLWIYMQSVPAATDIYIDSVKLEKLGIDSSHKGMSQYGGTLTASGVPVGSVATGYKFVAGADNDNHSPNMIFNVEEGKTYRASTKVYIPSSNKTAVEQVIAAAAADETAYSKNLTPGIKFGSTKVDLVYDQWVDVSFDYTADATKAYRFSLDGINVGYYYGTGAYKTVKETFYFQGFDFAEVTSAAAAAGLPDITFESGNWSSWGVTLPADTTILDGETAKQATKTVSYGITYVKIPDLVEGDKYLAKAKFYLPQEQWVEGAKIKFFLIDNQAVDGSSGYTDDPNYAMHKTVVDITEDMAGKWIDVQLPFTHSKAATDTDGIYWINAVVTGIGGTGTYYIADPKFVDVNKANIENLEISANGTVTYTANAADYFLSYEYLDGTTVLESGMILAGEFLPKFDLADVEEPTVKLTASNAYGEAEETVVGTKAVEETPDIGGDEEEGVFEVNAVSIIPVANESDMPATAVAELADGMYIGINYTNPTEETKQVWLMMAYYDANGLKVANKYLVDLPTTAADASADVFVPEDEEEQIDFVAGSTIVKAFVWDVDSVEPLCAGYVVD